MTIKKFNEFRENANDLPTPGAPVDPQNPEVDSTDVDVADLPALFATIHHQSDTRPNGYTADDIEQLNHAANAHRAAPDEKQEDPAKEG